MNMKTPRIAYCSPVNPAPSGISDYSEELLPYLAQYADITLYVEDRLRPTNTELVRYLDVQPLRRLERTHRRKPYDAITYHIGNSPAHMGIWRMAQRIPGVVVLHDFVLHHFMLSYAALMHKDVQRYVHYMTQHYGEQGTHIAQLMIRGRFTETAFDFPCCEQVIASAYGLIAHSHYVQERVMQIRPTLPVSIVPMGVPLSPPIERADARARLSLNLPPDALILASFGHINAYKRLEPTLRAFTELRADYPNAHYILVGSVSPNYDAEGLIQRIGLEDAVTMTGYVSRQAFDDYVAATDICLNLRHPTAGETSASLLRLLGAGKPTLVSATGSFAELPADVAAQVDNDASERELILAYCQLLAQRPDVAAALGNNARAYVGVHHTLERAAQGYARFLARLYRWQRVARVRDAPLWKVGTVHSESPRRQERQKQKHHASNGVDGKLPCKSHQEPSKSHQQSSESSYLVASVAQSLVELGVTERDEQVLWSVASRMAEVINSE